MTEWGCTTGFWQCWIHTWRDETGACEPYTSFSVIFMERKDLSETISGHFLQYMNRNNPSKGKKHNNFFFRTGQFFFSQYYFQTSGYFMSFCCPFVPLQAFSNISYKLAMYSSSPNSLKKILKSKQSRTARGFVQRYTHNTWLCQPHSSLEVCYQKINNTSLTKGYRNTRLCVSCQEFTAGR